MNLLGAGPSHLRPVSVHFLQHGSVSSHLTLRFLQL